MSNKKLAKTTINLIDGLSEIGAEEFENDPKVKELVKEYIKDLPPELTKQEIKNLSEKDRIERNKLVSKIREDLHERHNPRDDTYRVMYSARKSEGQIPASYEYMKEGAIRSVARNEALKICKSRYTRTKEELKEIKTLKKDLIMKLTNRL